MNADLAYNAAPEYLQAIQPGEDYSYPYYDAFIGSPVQSTWEAAYAALYSSPGAATAYNQLINRSDSGIPELLTAKQGADSNFWNEPTPETQQVFVDALKALYKAALEAPRMTFPASFDGATYGPVAAPATPTQDSAMQVRYANAEIAYQASQANATRRQILWNRALYRSITYQAGSYTDSYGYQSCCQSARLVGKMSRVLVAVARSFPSAVLRRPSVKITRWPVFTTDPSARRAPF